MTSKALRISEPGTTPALTLPLDAITRTTVIYGGKGKGKTNLGAVMCEEFARALLRFCVIDPLDVWWGLRFGADRNAEGIDVVILGGVHGDLAIMPDAGALVADFVADEQANTIVVMRKANGETWTSGERVRFMRDFMRRLFKRQGEDRRPIHVLIDEAGRFVPQTPQRGDFDITDCIGAIEEAVEWGRNYGIGVTLITQRSARMNKSVSELAECMVAFGMVGPRSVDAVMDWFGEHVEKERHKQLSTRLRELPTGTALVVSPEWLKFEGEVQMRRRTTFDSSATPKAGAPRARPGKAKTIDLGPYRAKMASVSERAKADDPKALLARVRELEGQLAKRATVAKASGDTVAAEKAEAVREKAKAIAVRIVSKRVAALAVQAEATMATFNASIAKAVDAWKALAAGLASITAESIGADPVWTGQARPARAVDVVGGPAVSRITMPDFSRVIGAAPASGSRLVRQERRHETTNGDGGELTKGKRRILNALGEMRVLSIVQPSRLQLRVFANYDITGGRPGMELAELVRVGMVDTPRPGFLELTPAGQMKADHAGVPSTLRELHERVLRPLSLGRRRILEYLINNPEPITREDLRAAISYDISGGRPGMELAALLKVGYVESPQKGVVKVSPVLFPSELS